MIVAHGHVHVNGRRWTCPATTSEGRRRDRRSKSRRKSLKKVKQQSARATARCPTQAWLQLDREKPEATVVALPTREDVPIPVEEHLIVELCSK